MRTSYEASAPIAAPIALLRVERADGASPKDATWGWERLTTSGAISVVVSGGHISMLMPPHVGQLACRLGEMLGRVAEGEYPEYRSSIAGAEPGGASIVA